MNEPRAVESVTNECQLLGRAHESSSARAEQLIACLEGEIAKRDERIVELEKLYQELIRDFNAQDAVYTYSSKQETKCAGCGVRKHTPLRVDEMGGYVCLTCIDKKLEDFYAAPVSEAKAQGVVMPESKTKADYGVYIDEFADEAAAIYNAALDEVARLNAAPAAPAADACKACNGTGRRPIGGRGRIFGLTNRCFECQPLTAEEVYGTGDGNDQ